MSAGFPLGPFVNRDPDLHLKHNQKLYVDRDFGAWVIYCDDCKISLVWGYAGITDDLREADIMLEIKGGTLKGFEIK